MSEYENEMMDDEIDGDMIVEEELDVEETGEENDDDDLFEDGPAPCLPEKYVTLRTSAGDAKYVEVKEDATPLLDIITNSGLKFAGAFEVYFNNAAVPLTTLIPAMSTVTVVGSLKGG